MLKQKKGLLLICVVCVMFFALTGCGKKTVKLNDYVNFSVDGYDSMGTLSYEFDYDTFKKDYAGKIKISSNNKEMSEIGILSGMDIEELMLDMCVDKSIDKTTELSNGDVVTLKWNCEDVDAEEYFNVKLDYSDITYTVSGLKEVGRFNPFDYVKVSFDGISPDGKVTVIPDSNKDEMQYINFSIDKNSGLKTGDTITVTASISGSAESFIEKYGAVLDKTEETYTVDGLARYITDISDIPEDMYNKMDKPLQDVLNSDFASWENEKLNAMDLLGTYTITLKDGMSESPNNYVYFVYKVTAENDKSDGEFSYYWYGYFTDVLILTDGTCTVDLSSYKVVNKSYLWSDEVIKFGGYRYYGYTDLDSLFNKQVVSKIEKYEYKSTIQ